MSIIATAGKVYVRHGATLEYLGELLSIDIASDGTITPPMFVPMGATVTVSYPFEIFDPPPVIHPAHRPKGPPPQPTGKGRLKRW